MGQGWAYKDYDTTGAGGAVLDGIPPRDKLTPVLKRLCLGPAAQTRSLCDTGFPSQCHPNRTQPVPWVDHMSSLCPTGEPTREENIFAKLCQAAPKITV